jgi:hypothetical protein
MRLIFFTKMLAGSTIRVSGGICVNSILQHPRT